LRNVILTPHIGGSTEEAQENIGHEVAESLCRVLLHGSTLGAVNFPQVDCPPANGAQRLVNVHRNVPGVLGEINGIMSRAGANIKAQYLSTDNKIGYLVVDIESVNSGMLAQQVAALPTSIQTHLL
jgi:D-3-phosphoglycerate dehydrogenase / 2-oxoglutarate reductase